MGSMQAGWINRHRDCTTNAQSSACAQVMDGGQGAYALNELEVVGGEVWANVWNTDCIARIDPKTGAVKCGSCTSTPCPACRAASRPDGKKTNLSQLLQAVMVAGTRVIPLQCDSVPPMLSTLFPCLAQRVPHSCFVCLAGDGSCWGRCTSSCAPRTSSRTPRWTS